MTFYCANCWAEVMATAQICPRCGDDILARQARADFVEKLISALRHPEPTTPIRAAWILGQRRERRAVPALIQLARESADPFIIEAAVAALARINDPCAEETLRWSATHPTLRVRRAASGPAAEQ
ncbi:MAG: HEAT repeat domain-containing protein [Verrucomicrobia bacterium]|nr:HEAT repeat domain-containing protein [Verrucomicrobiota bacterium]